MTHAPLIHPLPHPIDLLALQQHDPARFPLLMESTASGTAQGRWSLLLVAQGDGLRLDADGQVRDQHDLVQPGTFLQALDRAWQHERLSHDGSHSLPFRGGWALMLDYEVASQIEPVLPARARGDGRPTALALRCPAAVLHDHHNEASFVIAEAGEQALLDALVALASAALPEAGQG
ncbi:TPA: aminodeoxychorismate synthase, component I, partial [Stenotrophomonas maltophilia]